MIRGHEEFGAHAFKVKPLSDERKTQNRSDRDSQGGYSRAFKHRYLFFRAGSASAQGLPTRDFVNAAGPSVEMRREAN